jgi:hypothetical protein
MRCSERRPEVIEGGKTVDETERTLVATFTAWCGGKRNPQEMNKIVGRLGPKEVSKWLDNLAPTGDTLVKMVKTVNRGNPLKTAIFANYRLLRRVELGPLEANDFLQYWENMIVDRNTLKLPDSLMDGEIEEADLESAREHYSNLIDMIAHIPVGSDETLFSASMIGVAAAKCIRSIKKAGGMVVDPPLNIQECVKRMENPISYEFSNDFEVDRVALCSMLEEGGAVEMFETRQVTAIEQRALIMRYSWFAGQGYEEITDITKPSSEN